MLHLSVDTPQLIAATAMPAQRPRVSRASEPAPVTNIPKPAEIVANARRGEPRHPLSWSGTVHFSHDSQPVRLRNISPHGALIESPLAYPIGAELYLDLEEAGSLFATVSWSLQASPHHGRIFCVGRETHFGA